MLRLFLREDNTIQATCIQFPKLRVYRSNVHRHPRAGSKEGEAPSDNSPGFKIKETREGKSSSEPPGVGHDFHRTDLVGVSCPFHELKVNASLVRPKETQQETEC